VTGVASVTVIGVFLLMIGALPGGTPGTRIFLTKPPPPGSGVVLTCGGALGLLP
jgi:hypothetical protein